MRKTIFLCGIAVLFFLVSLYSSVNTAVAAESFSSSKNFDGLITDTFEIPKQISGIGSFDYTATNNTGIDWLDFHFYLTDFSDSSAVLEITNVFADVSTTTAISGTNIDYYFSNPLSDGATVELTFAWTIIGSTSFDILATPTTSGAPVPEPSTIILIGLGLVGLAGFGRKKIKK